MKIHHYTSKEKSSEIYQSGYLRQGTYVTPVSLEPYSPYEKVTILCLDDLQKGECQWKCEVDPSDLIKPMEGIFTCQGWPQYQLRQDLPTENCSLSCESNGKILRWAVRLSCIGGGAAIGAWLDEENRLRGAVTGVAIGGLVDLLVEVISNLVGGEK